MPASPSFPSDNRGKWKRRKPGESQIGRKLKHEEEDAEDDEEDNNNNDDELENSEDPQQNGVAAPDPGPSENEVLAEGGIRICDFPAVIKRVVNRAHISVTAIVAAERACLAGESKGQSSASFVLENVSHGQLQAVSAVPVDSPALDHDRSDASGGSSGYVITPPPIMEGQGAVKRFGTRVHVVPMHSDWFSPSTVNRLERQVVPHFFSGKSPDHTPEKYMECRNYAVAKYMDNPERKLSVSDCQGLVEGVSNDDLTRIVRFLDHWGIINYCAADPGREPWTDGSYLREDPSGEVHVPSAALKSIDSLIKFDKPKCRFKASDVYSSVSSHNDDISDLDSRIRERFSENYCNYCSQPVPTVYYQSQKEVDVLLCSDCFHEGRFVIGHSSIDFLKIDLMKDYGDMDGETWSNQETLLLLQAMEIYNENWNEIAEHVSTKSKAQCIIHFLRLPMEDGLLESIEVPSLSKPSNSSNGDDSERMHSNGDLPETCPQEADSAAKLPFVNSSNPVMSLVAFLASAVGPRVAAACAHASLATLAEDDKLSVSEKEESGHGNRMNSDKLHTSGGNSQAELQPKEENSALHGSFGQNGVAVTTLSKEKVKAAAKAGLSAAATKAKLFADHEEREIQRLSANIINHQLKRLELKLKQFAEVETLLMKECEQVEKARQRFSAERARTIAARFGPASSSSSSQVPLQGGNPQSMAANNNNRQQMASPSQPSISGFNNNQQQVHPQMPFMARQQMFSMGPRVPLNAMQPSSSSAPSNVMFNPTGNTQSTLNHPMLRSVSGANSGLG